MEPIKLWIVQHATITRDASPRREFDGINWDLGSGIVENARVVRGNVHTRILHVHDNIYVFVYGFIYGFAYLSIFFKLTPSELHGERISQV